MGATWQQKRMRQAQYRRGYRGYGAPIPDGWPVNHRSSVRLTRRQRRDWWPRAALGSLIVDDPHSFEHTEMTPEKRAALDKWFTETMPARIVADGNSRGPVATISYRLHEDDLSAIKKEP